VRYVYAEWAGAHDWAYWRGHLGESLAWLLDEVAPRSRRSDRGPR
jgi:enterochelin esterase-like enzyme